MNHPARTALFAAVAVFGSVLISLGLAEAALVLLDVRPTLSSDYMLDCDGCRKPHRDLLVVEPRLLKPKHYATKAGVRSIVTIGDSFTEGTPFGPTGGYPIQLERRLRQAGLEVRVINAGHGDSGPDQQHRLLDTVVLPQTQPSVVVWQFYFNDIGNNYVFPAYGLDADGNLDPLDASANWLYLRQSIFDAIPAPFEWKSRARLLRLSFWGLEHLRGREAPIDTYAERIRWSQNKIRAELADFDRLAAEHGFRPYVALVVAQACYEPAPASEKGLERWTSIQQNNEQLRALLVDHPGFIELYFPDEDPSRVFTTDETAVSEFGARHYSLAGYELMAKMIAQRILADDAARDAAR